MTIAKKITPLLRRSRRTTRDSVDGKTSRRVNPPPKLQRAILSPPQGGSLAAVDRAVHEIRCGRSVNIDGAGFIHPEFIDEKTVKCLCSKNASLIITANRAAALTGKKFAASQQVALKNLSLEDIHILICGGKSKKFALSPVKTKTAQAALKLAKIAETLPCAIIFAYDEGVKISAAAIMNYDPENDASLQLVAAAPLNLYDAKRASIKAFRSSNGAAEHLAIIIGSPGAEPLVRIHSSCYTGDLLDSLTCDCGDQLRSAIRLMDIKGGGIIIYLMQEGRGIGLINKLRAYHLQSSGLDTVEANEFLGFNDEERSYVAAAVILKKLKIKKLRLLTNNPKKTKGLSNLGIKVTSTVPLIISHVHNRAYLATKSAKSGHIIN